MGITVQYVKAKVLMNCGVSRKKQTLEKQ